jgi:hypothetical protein
MQRGAAGVATTPRQSFKRSQMPRRTKFEAVDKNGKPHKRASVSRFYSHCVVIHFAVHPPSKLWPKGIAACSHAEWAGTQVRRSAS